MVNVVEFVTIAEVISPSENVTSDVVVPSPLISQDILFQLTWDLTSTPFATPRVSKLVPVKVMTPVAPSYPALLIVVVGAAVSIANVLPEKFAEDGTVVDVIELPNKSVTVPAVMLLTLRAAVLTLVGTV